MTMKLDSKAPRDQQPFVMRIDSVGRRHLSLRYGVTEIDLSNLVSTDGSIEFAEGEFAMVEIRVPLFAVDVQQVVSHDR